MPNVTRRERNHFRALGIVETPPGGPLADHGVKLHTDPPRRLPQGRGLGAAVVAQVLAAAAGVAKGAGRG